MIEVLLGSKDAERVLIYIFSREAGFVFFPIKTVKLYIILDDNLSSTVHS